MFVADDDVEISRCPGCAYWCGIYRTIPGRREVQEQHSSTNQGQDGPRFGALISRLQAGCARYRARHAILSADEPTQVIDFGCGQGYFLDALRSSGHQCLGIETSEATNRHTMDKGHRMVRSLDALADINGNLKLTQEGCGQLAGAAA